MQKLFRSIAITAAVAALPALAFASEPMGGNPRPQATASATGEPMGGNPRPQLSVIKTLLLVTSTLSGR